VTGKQISRNEYRRKTDMAEAALSLVAGPVISSVLQNVLGSSSGASAGGATGSNGGLFGGLLNDFSSAFGGLFGSNSSNSTTGCMGFPVSGPMPFSTANMSQTAYNNPMSQLSPAFSNGQVLGVHRHFGGFSSNSGTLGSGASINSGDDASLNSAQASYDQAQQIAQANPDNLADQNNAQQAQLNLQNLFNRISSESKMFAQMFEKADQNSVLQS
jgi:hypothetical protein